MFNHDLLSFRRRLPQAGLLILLGILCGVGADPAWADPALLGQWPGVSRDGEAQGVVVRPDLNLAFVAAGEAGLMIFDVTERSRPFLRGRLDTPGFAKAVEVQDTRAYVADGDGGLAIVDVSNPVAPVLLGRHDTAGFAEDVVVAGSLAFVADGSEGWLIVDVANPVNPSRVSTSATLGRAGGLDVAGSLVYVAEGESGLQVYDASNPVAPSRLGGFDTPGFAAGVQVIGTTAYIADGPGGVRILGVGTPGIPTNLGVAPTAGPAWSVWVEAGIAAVAGGEGGFQLIRVSTPASPVALATVPSRGGALAAVLSGPTAYVADLHSGLMLFAIETPTAPLLTGGASVGGESLTVRTIGSRAYVADWNAGLAVLDVSQSSTPIRVGGYGPGTSVSDVEMVGTLAFVADYRDGLVVLDMANPLAPARLGAYAGVTRLSDILLVGTRAYLAHGTGLEILDISNLATPVRLGGYVTDGEVFRVQVVGSTAYLAVHRSHNRPGFQMVGVSNPASPTYLGGYVPAEPVHGLFVAGTRAYLAASEAGVLILNVANPASASLLGTVDTRGPALAVELTGTTAFVTEGGFGIASYDVATPASIRRTGELDTRGTASGIRLSGTLAYVADGIGGVAVVAQSVPVNNPPEFPTIPNLAADEGVLWELLVSATDAETPSGSLIFSLVEGPPGFSISPFGRMRWTPTEEQGPQFYTIRVAVTDTGSPPESTTNAFQLQVREINLPPVLPPLDLVTIVEEQPLTFQLTASDADRPGNSLTYSLANGPEGMTISPSGELTWTPTELQGPATLLVSVGVVDNGVPPQGTTNFFPVMVLESNKRPVMADVPPQTVDEGTQLSVQWVTTDDDRPANALTHALVSGPEGLSVSPSGLVTWTPTEAQGPMVTTVVVRVSDNGSPSLSATNQFEVTVREVNRAPVLAEVPRQTVDALVPLSVDLEGSDPDLPANSVTFTKVSGPDGLTVSEAGQVRWTPGPDQAPSTNVVRVRIADNGSPSLNAEREFLVVAWAVEERAVIQLGVDDDPEVLPYVPHAEFGPENDVKDPAPGRVTRLSSDPEYDAASNPGPDDDYYLQGLYRSGFNQLSSLLQVPNDEPWSAWERAVIPSDSTNRLHFRLTAAQAVPETWVRVIAEFPWGGTAIGGVVQPGFADHDLALRVRNADGAAAEIFSGRLSAPTRVVTEFPLSDVGAVPGPATLEFVREGPTAPSTAFWLIYDFVRVEIDAGGNEAPLISAVPAQTVDEGVPWNWTLTASDPDVPATPMTFGLVSGPSGMTVSPSGQIAWIPAEDQGPGTYPVTVQVTDNGIPVRSTATAFTITVREVNRPPVPASPGTPVINELETLRLLVAASDPDLPANHMAFALESGPDGLTVDPAGIVTWTPNEAQGPGVFPVAIRVSDDGVPPLGASLQFEVTVPEVNTPPRLGSVPSQIVDRLAPLEVALVSADDDLPANLLTHSLVEGPEGATVSPEGVVRWRPEPGQAPSTNRLVVRVTDNGSPVLFAEQEFTVIALPVEERAIVQVGVDDDPEVLPYNPRAEFRAENSLVDPSPGAVTRIEGDPLFDPGAIPAADDHYYARGIYAPGFNGLGSRLVLPNDEPFAAWETALTSADPVNQLHFRLTEAQTAPGSWIRVVTEFPVGGSATGGQVNPGFAEHEVTVRFRSASGALTTVFSGQVNPPARLVTEFPLDSVGAAAGPNSIEWARTGPVVPGTAFWLTYDFVRLEMDAGGNEAPVITPVDPPSIDEEVPWSLALAATDPDLPPTALTYTLISGPPGLTVSTTGLVEWTPTESQGPLAHPVAVRVTDNGVPIRSTTNEFVVTVREVNRPPALAPVADPGVDELAELNVALAPTDEDLPANPLTYTVVSGPEGLVVGPDGVIRWTPTEAQGPAAYPVSVKVVDNGVPSLEAVREFTVTVREVNTAPIIAEVPLQPVDRLAPLEWRLDGSDGDLPLNALTYFLVSGPEGLTVSPSGEVFWRPDPSQAPSTHQVVVRVADDGVPPLEGLREFTVVAGAVEERALFQIGEDEDPEQVPYLPYDEFTTENFVNDLMPGSVTREPTDPEYVSGANPGPDDDFFMRGNYPRGFLGLPGRRVLPNDEPAQAWELALTSLDLTNRIHFRLTESQAVPETWIRVLAEFAVGGSATGGIVSPGFSEHDVRVGFRNAAGAVTEVAARRFTEPGTLVAEFNLADVGATAGPGSIELARVGPLSPGTAYWLNFDYVRIEVDAGGNEAPLLAAVPEQIVDEQTLLSVTLEGRDTDQPPTPLTYSLVSGPPGLVVSREGLVTWTPGEDQGPSTQQVSVRVTDNGIPIRSTTNSFSVVVREVNREPVLVPVDPITFNEQERLSVQLAAADEDLPGNGLTYSLVDGPSGLSVSPQGLLLWTPTEAQGPSTASVQVRITDDGVPPLSTTRQIELAVREVNTAPEIAGEPVRHVDRLAPLDIQLRFSDADLPPNGLVFSLDSGPDGAVVDADGRLRWNPGPIGAPVTNQLVVRISDDGQPVLSSTRPITVVAWPVEERTIFQIGVNDDPATPPYEPAAEFSPANGIQDPEPGGVTLLPEDPDYNAGANPPADDDFFFRGIYPQGHHGRESQLRVGADEPAAAWESRLTAADPVNRLHFRLTGAQADTNTWLRLVVAISDGGSGDAGSFGEHDLAFRFHNALGEVTEVLAQRVTSAGELVAEFDAARVRALPGAAMMALVRNGPVVAGADPWVEFDYVRLEVDPGGNQAPTLAEIPDQTLPEQTLLRIALDAGDTDVPPTPLAYRIVNGPEGLTVSDSGLVEWTPSESQGPSSQEVTVEVADNGIPVLRASRTFRIVVSEVNRAPIPDPVTQLSAPELVPFEHLLTARDPDEPGNRLEFSLIRGPAGLTLTSAGRMNWIPLESQGPSTSRVVVRVSDNGQPPLRATNEFFIAVTEVNSAPLLNEVPAQVATENLAWSYALVASDTDRPLNRLTYSLVSGPAGMEVSATGLVTWTPGEDRGGTEVPVVVRVRDDGVPALEADRAFSITVEEDNRSPVLAVIPNQVLTETNQFRWSLVAEDPDLPRNGLQFARISGPEGLTVSPTGEIAWEPSETQGGRSHPVSVRVSDDGNPSLSAERSFLIEVTEANQPPRILDIPTDPVPENEFFIHVLSVADPDVPLNGYSFDLLSGPEGFTISSDGLIEWTPSEAQGPSTNTVIVRVTDSGIPPLSATNEFRLVVSEVNTAPRLPSPGRQTIPEMASWALALGAVDPDLPPNPLKYSLVSGPSGLTVGEEGLVSWEPTELQGPSTNEVVVSVSDGFAGSRPATNRFTVVVTEVNQAPVLEPVAGFSALPGEEVLIVLTALDLDQPRRNQLRYELVAGDSQAFVDAQGGVFIWQAQGAEPVAFTIRVVDDGTPALSDEETFIIRVGGPDLQIRQEGSQVVLEYEVRPGWAYTLLGLPFDRLHETAPSWSTVVGEKIATASGRETTRLSPDQPAQGQVLRVEARSTSPR